MKKKIFDYGFEMLVTIVMFFIIRMVIELIFDTGESWKDIAIWAILCGIVWPPIRRYFVKKDIIKDEFK